MRQEGWDFEVTNDNVPVCLGKSNCGGLSCNSVARDGINDPVCRIKYYEERELQRKQKSFWYRLKRKVGF